MHGAIKVSDVIVGAVLVWNTGAMSVVTKIDALSPKFVNVHTCELEWAGVNLDVLIIVPGSEFVRRMKLDRLVGYSRVASVEFAAAAREQAA
jgi:hypothetical protein